MAYEEPHDGMEMPTPCQKCGGWFDLNDGVGSDKWFPNTVICEECSRIEQQEIEVEEEIDALKSEIEDAEYTLKTSNQRMTELEKKLEFLQNMNFEPNQ